MDSQSKRKETLCDLHASAFLSRRDQSRVAEYAVFKKGPLFVLALDSHAVEGLPDKEESYRAKADRKPHAQRRTFDLL